MTRLSVVNVSSLRIINRSGNNQTAEEYDGRFNTSLIHKGPTGQYITNDTWKKGSAYPDSFIIGDPHLNFYEGDAIIDDIRLYTK